MSTRLEKFHGFATHAWFKKYFEKLSTEDFKIIHNFLEANKALNKDEFEFKVNRMFLDNPNKPKSWQIIVELLANSNV